MKLHTKINDKHCWDGFGLKKPRTKIKNSENLGSKKHEYLLTSKQK